MNIRPLIWWIVFAVLLAGGAGFFGVLTAQGHDLVARVTLVTFNVLAGLWVIFGLWRWRETPVVRRIGLFLAFTFAAQLVASVFHAFEMRNGVTAVAGIWAMTAMFFGGMLLVRLLLAPGHPVLGVARTLVDEAVRMKTPLVFLVVLVLIVPVLPFVLDEQDQLRYRLQTFLTWSMTATGVLLSLMTIFLAVGSITSEVQHRQIFLTMTKPVSRGGYLFGKWLGIAALNLVLVAVCGVGIYAFTKILASQPAMNAVDAAAVEGQVLVARQTITPMPANVDLPAMYADRLARLRATDPVNYGSPGDPPESLPPELRGAIQSQILNELYVVPPRGQRAFRFAGLDGQAADPTVQLRLKPRPASPSPDGTVYLFFRLNGYLYEGNPVQFVESQYRVLELDPRRYNVTSGELLIEVANPGRPDPREPGAYLPQPSVTFDVSDGVEMLYRVGGFEGNFVRGLIMMWLRLSFLAMLGLAAGAALSFPIACLVALLVYVAAIGSGYIGESLDSYARFPNDGDIGSWDWLTGLFGQVSTKIGEGDFGYVLKLVIKLLGSGFMALVPSFADYNPTPMVADGRWVSPRMLGEAALWVGVVWSGVIAFIAWIVWRRRELARVTV